MPEIWLQIENRPWDVCPHDIDRMTGLHQSDISPDLLKLPPTVSVKSPTGAHRDVKMFRPLRDSNGNVKDALIYRRYKPPVKADKSDAWTIPDDRKTNPWDINEADPTDTGTMGTIPGPVLECNVGDALIVHFRNLDMRTQKVKKPVRVFIPGLFDALKDPMGMQMPSKSTAAGAKKSKMGSKSMPKGTKSGGPLVAAAIVPMADSMKHGPDISRVVLVEVDELIAIEHRSHSLHPHGIVFRPESDGAFPLSPPDTTQPIGVNEVGVDETPFWQSLPVPVAGFKQGDRVPPGGTFTYTWNTFGWPSTAGVWLYHDHSTCDMDNVLLGAIGILVIHNNGDTDDVANQDLPGNDLNGSPVDPKGNYLAPSRALFLQLFHSLGDVGTVINGRKYLGNTPTLIAGVDTVMRFGVVGMGSAGDGFHTFHIHGHRWVIPGPGGTTTGLRGANSAVQDSLQNNAASQFEDTRTFGPANSFTFTIRETASDGGPPSFMRGGGPSADNAKGEWHMHCHVLDHMMMGMMGSLKVVRAGDPFVPLPVGYPCPKLDDSMGDMPPSSGVTTVTVENFDFSPASISVAAGSTVTFMFKDPNHSVTTVSVTGSAQPIEINGGASGNNSADSATAIPQGISKSVMIMGNSGDQIKYMCGIHLTAMTGSIVIA